MVSQATILGATLPVFLVIAAGFWLRRRGLLEPGGDQTLMTLTVSVTYPCYILRALLGSEALRQPGNVALPLACGIGFAVVGIILGWLLGPWFGLHKGTGRRTFAIATAVQNYGYLPIPIMEAIFPAGQWKGVLFVYGLGIEIAVWTLGVMLLSGDWRRGLRQALNPVVVAVVVGLVLNAIGWDRFFPAWSLSTLDRLGACSIPLGLLIAGITLADLLRQSDWLADWRTPIGGVLLRLAVLPALMLAAAHWLPMTPVFRQVIAVQAAMPAAVFPVIIARRYGGHEPTAVRVLVFTTLVSIFTIPAAVAFALRWVAAAG